jgi:hypothetical protein
MRPMSTHFEQIPLDVVRKIAAETPKVAAPGRRVRRSAADIQAPLSPCDETIVPVIDAGREHPPGRGVR